VDQRRCALDDTNERRNANGERHHSDHPVRHQPALVRAALEPVPLPAQWPRSAKQCDREVDRSVASFAVSRCDRSAVGPLFLPTYSSWQTRIECEFAAPRYFALNVTDHRSHGEQDDAIGATSSRSNDGIRS
jgi:hypothetical protein